MAKSHDPRMHSAEHILNRTMVELIGTGRCFSAHIEKKRSKCDYHFDRDLTEAETAEIEARVNDIIRSDLPVIEEFPPRGEAEKEFNLGRLPDGAGDTIRVIRMGDYDACPCIGDHVSSTGEIGAFRITTTSYEDGVLRLRYKLDQAP